MYVCVCHLLDLTMQLDDGEGLALMTMNYTVLSEK